jgi:hypothetical protein
MSDIIQTLYSTTNNYNNLMDLDYLNKLNNTLFQLYYEVLPMSYILDNVIIKYNNTDISYFNIDKYPNLFNNRQINLCHEFHNQTLLFNHCLRAGLDYVISIIEAGQSLNNEDIKKYIYNLNNKQISNYATDLHKLLFDKIPYELKSNDLFDNFNKNKAIFDLFK